jgi:hypothetical protein
MLRLREIANEAARRGSHGLSTANFLGLGHTIHGGPGLNEVSGPILWEEYIHFFFERRKSIYMKQNCLFHILDETKSLITLNA